MIFGVMLLSGMGSPDQRPAASGGLERAASVRVSDAPEAVSGQEVDKAQFLASEEEHKKTVAEKNEVDEEAAQKSDEKEAASDQAAQKPDQKEAPV